ncbi:MAG: RibD family protein [Chloroflexi bacterium]|nr:RibD family protein [Chloroflexota bacterium]
MAVPDYTTLEFPDPPDDRPHVILDMIASADGKTVIEGNEAGLGSRTDRRLLHELRLHADVVLAGAGTLRATGASPRLYDDDLEVLRLQRGKSRMPVGAVISASGDVPLDAAFFTSREFDAYLYLADSASPARRAAIEETGRPVVDVPANDAVPAMLRHMRSDLGARLVMLEGGPTLNGECFRAGVVDELFLTLGGVVVGGSGLPTAVEMPGFEVTRETVTRLELRSAAPNPETDEVYLRYRVRR